MANDVKTPIDFILSDEEKGNREYASDCFCMLMQNAEYALDVYNALNGSNYTDSSLVEVIQMQGGFSLTVRNDAAYIFDNYLLNIYEHQRTYNPNMAIRLLVYYVTDILKIVPDVKSRLLSSKKVMIPAPRFVVFYNGKTDRPAVEEIKLSDHYVIKSEKEQLDLSCKIYNLNTGYNDDLINKSHVLKGYCTFIELIDKYAKNYLLGTAIDKAMQDCIDMDILADFFRRQGGEVKKVIELDYTFEAQLATERKDKAELLKLLEDKDAELADKNAELADKDAELEKMRALLRENGIL